MMPKRYFAWIGVRQNGQAFCAIAGQDDGDGDGGLIDGESLRQIVAEVASKIELGEVSDPMAAILDGDANMAAASLSPSAIVVAEQFLAHYEDPEMDLLPWLTPTIVNGLLILEPTATAVAWVESWRLRERESEEMPSYTVSITATAWSDGEAIEWSAGGEMHPVTAREIREIRRTTKPLAAATVTGQRPGYTYEVRVGPDQLDKPFAIAVDARGGSRPPKPGDGRVVWKDPKRANLTIESELLERAKAASAKEGLSLNQWAASVFEEKLAGTSSSTAQAINGPTLSR